MNPTAKISGCFVNPTNPANAQASSKLATAAAESLGLKLQVFNVSKEDDFETAFASLAKQHADGLVIRNDAFYVMRPRCRDYPAFNAGSFHSRENSLPRVD